MAPGSSSSERKCRMATIDELADLGIGQDLVGSQQVAVDEGGVVSGGQQRPAVHDGMRVVVDVDDPAVGGDGLRDLVDVLPGRQARPDVEELADAQLRGQIVHRAHEERAVGQHHLLRLRDGQHHLVRGVAVHDVVVPAAEIVVIHPGDARSASVDLVDQRLDLVCHGDSVSSRRIFESPVDRDGDGSCRG